MPARLRAEGLCVFCIFRRDICSITSAYQICRPFSCSAPSARRGYLFKLSAQQYNPSSKRSLPPSRKQRDTPTAKQKAQFELDASGSVKRLIQDTPLSKLLSKPDASLTEPLREFLHQQSEKVLDPFKDLTSKVLEKDPKAVSDVFAEFKKRLTRLLDDRKTRDEYVETFKKRGLRGTHIQLRNEFFRLLSESKWTNPADHENQKRLADLRYPSEWYPSARKMVRDVHLHVGPTNSGKTYQALKRLEEAGSGVYAGPLRLLAQEVYARLNARGKPCMLVTGDERKAAEGDLAHSMISSTVEMIPLNTKLSVAVLDEIQMIGSEDRGWAWTQALLGVQADEVHLCGEERTVPLIKELIATTGDKLTIHKYERLSPLEVMKSSLNGDLNQLKKGDCVVVFSIMGIHAMRKDIEKRTGKKVAVIYGSLPPETRAQQARLFNDPSSEYDILVSSDAIGMGLNLSIKRIIFESAYKNNGYIIALLEAPQVKQIAGRAGRYRTVHQDINAGNSAVEVRDEASRDQRDESQIKAASNVGLVTTLGKTDFHSIRRAMNAEPQPILTAGLLPPDPVIDRFASYFPPGTPFSFVLLRLHEIAQMHPRYHLTDLRDLIHIADEIQPVEGLTTSDRLILCAAPADIRSSATSPDGKSLIRVLATCVAEQGGGNLLNIQAMPLEVLDEPPRADRLFLRELEGLHKGLILYLWLSYRFPGIFTTRALAFHVKDLTEKAIQDTLSMFNFSDQTKDQPRSVKRLSLTFGPPGPDARNAVDGDVMIDESDASHDARPAQGVRVGAGEDRGYRNPPTPAVPPFSEAEKASSAQLA